MTHATFSAFAAPLQVVGISQIRDRVLPSQAVVRKRPSWMTPRATARVPRPKTASQPSIKPSKFDWRSQWYPLALVCDLDPSIPTRITVIDTNLVVWRSNQGWTVFHDRCPHRFAALSQGRIDEEGRLECGYHGWQFNSAGICTRIPQSPVQPKSSPASCAQQLPSAERSGIIFAWLGLLPPQEGSEPATIQDARAKYITSSFSRTLPLCYTTLLQNILDPAHIHFAHHNQIGNRQLAGPVPIRILQSQSSSGFVADYYSGRVRLRFRPPSLVEIVTSDGLSFAYYVVPVQSGVVQTIAVRGSSRRPIFRVPRWVDHLRRNELIEGDLDLMITQEEEMRRVGTEMRNTRNFDTWGNFHMPTSADRLIVEMSRWLKVHQPDQTEKWFGFDAGNEKSMHMCKDRFSGHVSTCSSCAGALRMFEFMLISFRVGLICSVLFALLTPTFSRGISSCVPFLFSLALFLATRYLKLRITSLK